MSRWYPVGKEGDIMDRYVTGTAIKRLREGKGLTQQRLAEKLNVSDKAVSKWETGRGYPDISLIEPLAAALGVSVMELFSGESVVNTNRAANLLRARLYVCPLCGNVVQSAGEAVVSCCGLTLPPLEAEDPEESHAIRVERVEDEYYVEVDHQMTRSHHISFLAAVRDDGWELKKLYPEGAAAARFQIRGTRAVYCYCNRHGLYKITI